jgi:hypothetical protein
MGTDLARYRHPERVIESTNLSTPADQRVDVMAASPDWQTGPAPPRSLRRPRWLVATVTATSILLPTLSHSVVAVLTGAQLVSRLRWQWSLNRNSS